MIKKRKWLILAVIVFLVFVLMSSIAIANGKGPVTKSVGNDAAELRPAYTWFAIGSAYDNVHQLPESKGKVNVIQPNGNVDIILGISAEGLLPNSQYRVILNLDGSHIIGARTTLGNFITDAYGKGELNYTAPADTLEPGSYKWSIFINRYSPNATILISEDFEFVIEY